MPYYIASRTKKDEKTDNWVIQSESFRLKKDALVATEHITSFDKIRKAGGKVSVFNVVDLELLGVEIPKTEKPKIPNTAWLYLHTDSTKSPNDIRLSNINVRDLKERGRYAIAADGFSLAAIPVDLDKGNYPGKDGKIYEMPFYPNVDTHKKPPYPDIDVIIPINNQIKATFRVSTHWLHRSLKCAHIFAKQGSLGTALTVKREHKPVHEMGLRRTLGSNATLGVFGWSATVGESLDLLPCFLEGDNADVHIDAKRLLNALKGWKGHTQEPTHEFTQIHIPVDSRHGSILIEPYPAPIATKDERLPFAVIMPMHLGV